MVKKWGFPNIIYLDSTLFVVVGDKRPICDDGKDNTTGVHIVDNTLYDGGRDKGLGFCCYCHLHR